MKRAQFTAAAQLTGGFLAGLKRQKQLGGVWAVRGEVFSRVMVAGSDARLSGAELRVLLKIALHLMHLGRSQGMMTLKSLADDARVTQRTIRNALHTLTACGFLRARIRNDGKLELLLDRRFKRSAPVPANADPSSRRRSAAVKKISKKSPLPALSPRPYIKAIPLSHPTPERLNIPATAGAARRESTGSALRASTNQRPPANGLPYFIWKSIPEGERRPPHGYVQIARSPEHPPGFDVYGPAPPRKRA